MFRIKSEHISERVVYDERFFSSYCNYFYCEPRRGEACNLVFAISLLKIVKETLEIVSRVFLLK